MSQELEPTSSNTNALLLLPAEEVSGDSTPFETNVFLLFLLILSKGYV